MDKYDLWGPVKDDRNRIKLLVYRGTRMLPYRKPITIGILSIFEKAATVKLLFRC